MSIKTGGCLCGQVRYRITATRPLADLLVPGLPAHRLERHRERQLSHVVVANIWSASAPPWARLDPALERFERAPPPLPPAQGSA